jgi:SRSO17 transposase
LSFVDEQFNMAAAADYSVIAAGWRPTFEQMMNLISCRFARVLSRLTARDFLLGLLSTSERKTCWQLAELAGHVRPSRMQRLLREAVWDEDKVRDDLRAFVAEQLDHPDAVLIVDETGFVKKGTHSVGVQRQYSGTAGRIENCQVAVFLSYASPRGRALIDRRLYVPRSWTDDPGRCELAGVPEGFEFATKPALGLEMIENTLDAGVSVRFVTGDECYGRDPRLRQALQQRGVGYVLAVARNHYSQVTTRLKERVDVTQRWLSRQAWQRYACGGGSKGKRWYDWAWVTLHDDSPGVHSLLIRRNRKGELAFYRCWSPQPVSLSTLVKTAGMRWCVEESFQICKGEVGLDHYQCRGWKPWHRFTILAMLAMAILTVLTATIPSHTVGMIALTVPETRRLLTHVLQHHGDLSHILRWSAWRRRHQARAKAGHYKHHAMTESEQLK